MECIVAPYEADAQLAYLQKEGIVDLVITEDSDLLVFGCQRVLYKFDDSGKGKLIELQDLGKANNVLIVSSAACFKSMFLYEDSQAVVIVFDIKFPNFRVLLKTPSDRCAYSQAVTTFLPSRG